jgi:16S rRNA (cytosine967-C5)-methyltransferase
MISPARTAAYTILLAVATGRSDLPTAIARARQSPKDDRDHALASEIAIGVERRRATLDHLVAHFSARPIERLDVEILTILRLSLYQLLYLTRVPASAAVDDGVELTRRAGKSSASSFVNGVLREVSRQRTHLPLPSRPDDPTHRSRALDYLSITLSHPRWLAARWLDRLGFEVAEQWMSFNNQPAPITLRANRLRVTPEDLTARLAARGTIVRPGRFAPDALIVESGEPPLDGSSDAGSFVIQDEASQLVTLLAGRDPGPTVLDACASPGGKTTALAVAVGAGRIIACDVRDRRMALLRQAVAATAARNVWLVQANLLTPVPFRILFDCVVVDAPCSGLGTLRRDPDIRWRRQEADLSEFARSQLAMLGHAAAAVAPGGRLVYATCSSEPEENEDVAAAFLREWPQFAAIGAGDAHPALPADVVDERDHLRTRPDRHGLEAFFGAVFERGSPHL